MRRKQVLFNMYRSDTLPKEEIVKYQSYSWKKSNFEKYLRQNFRKYDVEFEPSLGRITLVGPIYVRDMVDLRKTIRESGLEYKIKEIIVTNVHNRKR